MFSEETIQHAKQLDFPSYLKASGLDLTATNGGSAYKTLCPFHPDKSPSLHVNFKENAWLWHCFGCDLGGDPIEFVMKRENLDFRKAVQKLLPSAPSSKPLTEKREAPSPSRSDSPLRLKLLERVTAFYQRTFRDDPRGLDYLRSRGIKDPAIFESFRIGFCNGTLFKAIPQTGDIVEQLKQIGILHDNQRESFENCIVVPLCNASGAVVSFYARKIHDNESLKHLYLSGPRLGLVNAPAFKKYPDLILTESILDALSLHQAGVKNAVPCYGVNGVTSQHLEQLKNNNTQSVRIAFDNDDTGNEGAERLKQKLEEQVERVELMFPKDGKDWNEVLIQQGEEALASFFLAAKQNNLPPPALPVQTSADGFTLKFCERRYQIQSPEGGGSRLRATIKAESSSKFHIDTFDLYSAKSRKSFLKDVSFVFKEEPEILENDLLSLIGSVEQYLKNKTEAPALSTQNGMTDAERRQALAFGKSPNLIEETLKDIEGVGYLGEHNNTLLCYCAMTSRKMQDPLSVMILSASGAGKSALQDAVLSFCPEEDLCKITAVTERALFYKERTALKHKVLAIAEDAGAEEAAYAIRNLISSKELTIEATVKDPLSGKLTTMQNTVEGPTSVFKTTTNPFTDPETRSRFFVLAVDESQAQTRQVLAHQREMQTLEGWMSKQRKPALIKKHQNFQRLLRPIAVFNPFARLLTYQDNKLWVRRDNPKYLQLIACIAFLHQLQRPLKLKSGIEYIEVTLEDIALANQVATDILSRSLDELSSPARKLLNILQSLLAAKKKSQDPVQLTRREIREASGWGETFTRTILNELVRLDCLQPARGGPGSRYAYEPTPDSCLVEKPFKAFLANVEELREKAKLLGIQA